MKNEIEEKLCEEHLRLISLAAEQSSEAMAISDLEGNLFFVNNAFASLHGYSSDELIGAHLSIFHMQEQIPSVAKAIWQLHETGEFCGEIWHVRRDDTAFPCLMKNSLVYDEKGKPIGMIGTIQRNKTTSA